jgi:hypothetical protein
MSVDTRIQVFYNKGYNVALADLNSFMDRVGTNFSHLKFNDKITAKDFLAAVMTQFNNVYGYNILTDKKDDTNGK